MNLHRCTWLFLVSAAFFAVSLSAQSAQERSAASNLVLTVTVDRGDAIYRQGETVAFHIHCQGAPDNAEVQWTISKDGVPPMTNGTVRLSSGSATATGQLDEPGFLQCRAVCRGSTAIVGVAVDPLEIKPSLPVPADFDQFWAAQKEQLASVPANARLAPVESRLANVECFDLQADSVGAPVSGYYARPVGVAPKSLPAILTVHGAGVRSSSLGTAMDWAGKGLLALDINAHGLPNGKPESYYTNLASTELKGYPTRGRESRETIYFLGMFLRLVRAIDFLTAQPEWDGRTLIVHGSSQGGAQSIVAAGLDSRVTFFAAGVPAMCDHTGVVVGRVNGWPKFLANPPTPADPKVVEAVRYYDAMNFATRARCPGFFTVGFIDTTCPPTSVYATYNAFVGPKQIFNDPTSPHTVTARAGEAMRRAIFKHIDERRVAAIQNTPPEQILLKDYRPRSIYRVPVTPISKARFPVIDMHAHDHGRTDQELADWVRTMDELGIQKTVVLSGAHGKAFDEVVARYRRFPGRFSVWCGFDYTGYDKPGYGPAAVAELERCFKAGAEGVGEEGDKGKGMFFSRPAAPGMHFDDPRMDPLLEKCGELRMPISIHVADPMWMYEPMDKSNDGLMNAYEWRIELKTNMLSHSELLDTLQNAASKHPRTTFVACHLANCCYDLAKLGALLDSYPNLYADISARYAETAPIPRAASRFFEKYQDRLVYGTDMGRNKQMYLTTFRVLETEDEHFYDWNLFTYHWPLSGFALRDEVLRKVYAENARKILPTAN